MIGETRVLRIGIPPNGIALNPWLMDCCDLTIFNNDLE